MIQFNRNPDYAFQTAAVRDIGKYKSVKTFVLGKSHCGRCIYALQMGNPQRLRLICGGFHGMEYLTVMTVLRFAEECAKSPDLLGDVGVVLVPCVNPDGTEIAIKEGKRWQANARGVDINHNFDADWCNVKARERAAGICEPAATRFGGCSPESEPETKALTKLCRMVCFNRVLALHSQGREIYWDFGNCTPPECRTLADAMAAVSGYKVAQPEPLATGGGFKDWFIQTFHRCGFTVEMGLGKNPLPLSDFETEYPVVQKILTEFINV